MESKYNKPPIEETLMPFGKYKGTKLKDLPDDYVYYLHGTDCYGAVRQYVDSVIDAVVANINRSRYYNKVEK